MAESLVPEEMIRRTLARPFIHCHTGAPRSDRPRLLRPLNLAAPTSRILQLYMSSQGVTPLRGWAGGIWIDVGSLALVRLSLRPKL